MRRLDSFRQRFAQVVSAWVVLVMPALVLSQSAGQEQQPPPPSPPAPVRMVLTSIIPRPAVPMASMVVKEPAVQSID